MGDDALVTVTKVATATSDIAAAKAANRETCRFIAPPSRGPDPDRSVDPYPSCASTLLAVPDSSSHIAWGRDTATRRSRAAPQGVA